MSLEGKTSNTIYESFKNPGVQLGYLGVGICAGVGVALLYLGEGANFIALCTGVGGLGILANTFRIQYKLAKEL